MAWRRGAGIRRVFLDGRRESNRTFSLKAEQATTTSRPHSALGLPPKAEPGNAAEMCQSPGIKCDVQHARLPLRYIRSK
jgi:hypothetical protein